MHFTAATALALLASQAQATFWDIDASKYSSPANSNNKCNGQQQAGYGFGELSPGMGVNAYGGCIFSGFTCQRNKLFKRTFGGLAGLAGFGGSNCIVGTVDKDNGPSFGGYAEGGFSVTGLKISADFDTDVEAHFEMPGGNTCKQTIKCKSSGTDYQNKQCGGASSVSFKQPPNADKPCALSIHSIAFDCSTSSTPVPPPQPTTPPGAYTTTPGLPATTTTTEAPVPTTTTTEAPVPTTTTTEAPVPTTTPASTYDVTTTPSPAITTSSTAEATTASTTDVTTTENTTTVSPSVYTTTTSPAVYTTPSTSEVPTTTTGDTTTVAPTTPTTLSPYPSSSETPTTTVAPTTEVPTTAPYSSAPTTSPSSYSAPGSSSPVNQYPTSSSANDVSSTNSTTAPAQTSTTASATTTTTTTSSSAPYTLSTTTASGPSSSAAPPAPAGCPGIVPSCLNTWMWESGCKNNADASCYCKSKQFIEDVMDCIGSWGTDCKEQSQAASYLVGICGAYVKDNGALVTALPKCATLAPSGYSAPTPTPQPSSSAASPETTTSAPAPYSSTTESAANSTSSSSATRTPRTITVQSTQVITITSCAATVTYCPARSTIVTSSVFNTTSVLPPASDYPSTSGAPAPYTSSAPAPYISSTSTAAPATTPAPSSPPGAPAGGPAPYPTSSAAPSPEGYTSVPATTIPFTSVATYPATDSNGATIPGSSSYSTINTTLTVPYVSFSTASPAPGESTGAVGLYQPPPTPNTNPNAYPTSTSAGAAAGGYGGYPAGTGLYTSYKPTGTQPAQFTGAAAGKNAYSGLSLGLAIVAGVAYLV